MPLVALLDSDSVLRGFEHVPVHNIDTARRIAVPDDCDLIPGRYVWRHDKARFVPIDDQDEMDRYEHMIEQMTRLGAVLLDNEEYVL